MIVLGRLSAAGRLPRNAFAGVRIPSTMRSDEAWVAGHRAASSALTAAGIGPVAAAAVVAVQQPEPETEKAIARAGNAWMIVWLAVATVRARRAARALTAA